MKSPGSLEQNIVYLAGEFTHRFHRALTSAFRKQGLNLTVEQFAILALLWYRDGINQQEISGQLGRDKTTVARVINTMERNQLIRRVIDPRDTRGKLVYLSTKGKSLQKKAVTLSAQLYEKCVGPLSPAEQTAGIAVLLKMMNSLS